MEYIPEDMPEVCLIYNLLPGQKQTHNQAGYEDEIEWVDIYIHNKPVSVPLYDLIVSAYGDDWDAEIRRDNE